MNNEKKAIWFDKHIWLCLQSIRRINGDENPSQTIERLIKKAYDEIKHMKEPGYARAVATA